MRRLVVYWSRTRRRDEGPFWLLHVSVQLCVYSARKFAVTGARLQIFGQNDMVSKLLELHKEHPFWLHVVGSGLATLGGTQPPEYLQKVLSQVDSMTLKIEQWLGVPPLMSVVRYHTLSFHFIHYSL